MFSVLGYIFSDENKVWSVIVKTVLFQEVITLGRTTGFCFDLQRVSLITSKLQESLESSFLDGLATDQSELVLRCLRTYALIDKTGHAEDLFRHNFVKHRIEKLISEDAHKEKGLQTICDDVIHFVKSDCQMVIKLTTEKQQASTKDEKEDIVKGFDFLINTVWPEIDNAFETRLSFIFSPGNPDLFFQVRIACLFATLFK